ncbi:hypothetical protein M6B38_378785 [Iris pallida]|uniref:Uncharacterized protein n=1 Tax=Iris pallida TaxID=29817 RepID=A0AAX6GAA1_IRIPA|nr:hypothetical protein M6B38_378785 [Iris pallida]
MIDPTQCFTIASARVISVQLLSLPFGRFTLEPVTRRQSFVFVSTAVRVLVVIDTSGEPIDFVFTLLCFSELWLRDPKRILTRNLFVYLLVSYNGWHQSAFENCGSVLDLVELFQVLCHLSFAFELITSSLLSRVCWPGLLRCWLCPCVCS